MEEKKIKMAQEALRRIDEETKGPEVRDLSWERVTIGGDLSWERGTIGGDLAAALAEYVRHLESIIQIQNKLSNEQCRAIEGDDLQNNR